VVFARYGNEPYVQLQDQEDTGDEASQSSETNKDLTCGQKTWLFIYGFRDVFILHCSKVALFILFIAIVVDPSF